MSGMSVKSWLSSIADRGRELLDLPISTPQEPLKQLGAMCRDLVSQKGENVAPRLPAKWSAFGKACQKKTIWPSSR